MVPRGGCVAKGARRGGAGIAADADAPVADVDSGGGELGMQSAGGGSQVGTVISGVRDGAISAEAPRRLCAPIAAADAPSPPATSAVQTSTVRVGRDVGARQDEAASARGPDSVSPDEASTPGMVRARAASARQASAALSLANGASASPIA